MGGAPEAEKIAFPRISTGRKPGGGDARGVEASGDIGLQIEQPVVGAWRRREVARIGRVRGIEPRLELRTHFVIGAADAGADGGCDAVTDGAERFHRGKCRFQHAADGALPAGMGGADHTRFRIGEQDGGAIGGQDAEREAGFVCHHRVGFGPFAHWPRCGHRHRFAAVNLVQSQKWCIGREVRCDTGAVLGQRSTLIARAGATIERSEDAGGHATLPPEKAMGDIFFSGEVGGGQDQHGYSLPCQPPPVKNRAAAHWPAA